MDINVQNAINAAVAAALADNAGPIAAFARTPALANMGLLNYGTSEGMKIFNSATEGLSTKYNGNTNDMHVFLKNVRERAHSFGWNSILDIPNEGEGGGTKNLIDHYGLITLETIQQHALTYESALGRNAQNSTQMYKFLYASISEETKLMVLSDQSDYTITSGDTVTQNGPAFLKVIIRNTTVDTRSTVFHIRENLNHLDTYMAEATYDIDIFNQYVTSQIEQLAARGEASSDLLINLFSAYMAVPDKKFVEYIEKQKDKYDEGEEVTTKNLMQVALIKYKDRKRADKWQAPSAEEAQIIALTAQVHHLQSNQKTKSNAETGSGKQKAGKKSKSNDKYAWKTIPPSEGEPKTKKVDKKEYHFCMNHNDGKGAWVIHLPKDCNQNGSHHQQDTKPTSDKALTLSKALQSIIEDSTDSDSMDDDE